MTARALMIQGTGSDVGKSTFVAGLCRVARRRGIDVAPFKPQNMSNNAAVAVHGGGRGDGGGDGGRGGRGGEIGRAQALQALAAGVEPSVDMNPVLLKPQSDRAAQVVVRGRVAGTLDAARYMSDRGALLAPVLESFERLSTARELVIVEGAGSPAEVNLRAGDIANMGFARAADVPVCLLGDIERGGVIAAVVGTQAVIDAPDAAMIEGFAINKFRGDPRLFDAGVRFIEERTGWPCFGVVPWLPAVARLPAEDAVAPLREASGAGGAAADGARRDGRLVIAAPMLSRIANFDDADPLRLEPGVDFRFVPPGRPLPRDADVVLLFGTKSTRAELAFLRAQGWHHDIHAHVRAGGAVLGLCGGYQLLGRTVADPEGRDGEPGTDAGLGLLGIDTRMTATKAVRRTAARCALSGTDASGYEIHVGSSDGPARARPMLVVDGAPEGARSVDGRVEGTYVHGLFAGDGFRRAWLRRHGLGGSAGLDDYGAAVDAAIDELADGLEAALDVDALLGIAR